MWEPQGNSQTVQLFLDVCISGGEGKARGSLGLFCFSFLLSLNLFPWGLRWVFNRWAQGLCSYSLKSPSPFLL